MHSKARNRLSTQRATDLVYVFSNMRLATRLKAVDHRQQQLPWEVEEKDSDASASDAAPSSAVSDSCSDSEP